MCLLHAVGLASKRYIATCVPSGSPDLLTLMCTIERQRATNLSVAVRPGLKIRS